MPTNLEQAISIQGDEHVDMSCITGSNDVILAHREMTLDNDDAGSISVQVKPQSYALRASDGRVIGERMLFGVFVESRSDNRYSVLVQTISGPARFTAADTSEPQFACERMALEAIGRRLMDFGRAALSFAGLITQMPDAKHTALEIYESTAPGVKLSDAIRGIQVAYATGRISQSETASILTILHESARESLYAFHNVGLVHGHAHLKNFGVDPATARVRLFDYTLAMQNGQDTAVARPGWTGMNDKSPGEDIASFESKWLDSIRQQGLPIDHTISDGTERLRVIAKLERAITLTAMRDATGHYPSDEDIDRYLTVQRELISDAPTVVYPHISGFSA